jgi:tryptophanyl-tRNA synthetase
MGSESSDVFVNPYEVKGNITEEVYSKLIRQFGLKEIDNQLLEKIKKYTKELHPLLKYKIFFAHRDLDKLLEEYEGGKQFYLYTGRGPSGPMHFGHIVPFIFTKWLQERFDTYLLIQITDDEKMMTRKVTDEEVRKYTEDNVLDILSLGFRKDKTFIIIDRLNAGILYNYAIEVAKRITVSQVKDVFGFTDSDNIGKFFFTSMQAVPSFILSALTGRQFNCLIPYAIDQDDHFRIARDVIPKLGFSKPASIVSKFLPSLLGEGKMSSSLEESAIYLSDNDDVVKKKIWKAFSGGRDTAEEQRKYGANPEVDVAFNIYRILEEDENKVMRVYEDYKSGKMLSGEMKQLAAQKMIEFLYQLRERKEKLRKEYKEFLFSEERIKSIFK